MHSLKEIALREVRPKHWQERLARVLPKMQSLTNLRFPVFASDLQPCVIRAAAAASARRGVTVKVAADVFPRWSIWAIVKEASISIYISLLPSVEQVGSLRYKCL